MELETVAALIINAINEFDAECTNDNYTDTGEAWALLNAIRDDLQKALQKSE